MCAQRRLRPVRTESSLCPQWIAKDPRFLHADREDSDQTEQAGLSLRWAHTHFICFVMSRLIICAGSALFSQTPGRTSVCCLLCMQLYFLRSIKTSRSKGNDRSPDSNMPWRSNMIFSAMKASNSKVNSPRWPNFEYMGDFTSAQITCKFHKDPIKMKGLCPEQCHLWPVSTIKGK